MDAKSKKALKIAQDAVLAAEKKLEVRLRELAQKVVAHKEIERFLSGNGSWSFYRASDGDPISMWERESHPTKRYDDNSGTDPKWLPNRVWRDIDAFEELAEEFYNLFQHVSMDVQKKEKV